MCASRVAPDFTPAASSASSQPLLPRSKELLFALGQLGWSSVAQVVGIQLVYFYIPPDNVESCGSPAANRTEELEPIFPLYITPKRFFVVLNVVVLLASSGRLYDAITDPLIASFSDNLRTKYGRRIPCLAVAALPCAASAAMLFIPPVNGVSNWNILWLALMQFLFYLFLTLYCTPYFALIPELGRTEQQRLDLSMWTAIAFAMGSVLASGCSVIGSAFTSDTLAALRIGIACVCTFGVICMLAPVVAIDELKYCPTPQRTAGLFAAIRHCTRNPHFRPYVASDFAFFFASAVIQTGMPFYLTVLLCEPISLLTAVMGGLVVFSLLWYYPVHVWVRRHGKKRLTLLSMLMLAAMFSAIFFAGEPLFFVPRPLQALAVPLLGAGPICVLGMLPNAILADISVHDALVSGSSNEGMFFAARTFLQKIGVTLGILVFASLTNFGKSPGDDLGVRLSGPVCAVVICLAAFAFSFYREDELIADVAQHSAGRSGEAIGGGRAGAELPAAHNPEKPGEAEEPAEEDEEAFVPEDRRRRAPSRRATA